MRKGACLYCGQIRMIEEDDMLRAVMEGVEAGKEADILATRQCDCEDAARERERKERREAAGEWARSTFSEQDGSLQMIQSAIQTTFEGAIDSVTVKINKYTHKIDTDSDGMIRIKTTYKESKTETF